MAWVLLDDNFPNHPKVAQANEVVSTAGWLFVCGLAYCRKYHTGGFVPRAALPTMGAGANPRRQMAALVDVGLWDAADGGWLIHDYEGFYADEDDKALKEARREAGRKGGLSRVGSINRLKQNDTFASKPVGEGVDRCSLQLLEEKKREADFANFWAAYPKKDGKQASLKAWMKLRPDDETQRAISADLERRGRSSQWLKEGGQFIPMAATYLNGRRWEDGFVERPRLAERTVNVLKGWEEPAKESA